MVKNRDAGDRMKFRQRIAQFMYGRNGYDDFSRFLLFAAIALMVLGLLFARVPFLAMVIQLAEWAALVYCVFRAFSRNIYKRQQENAKYVEKRQVFMNWFRSLKDRWQQRKDYKFFRCPSCHALLRVPRGKGKLLLTCRKCGNRFERKS